MDLRASGIYRSMDNRVFDIKDYRIGITANPFQPNCRTETVPYFDEDIQRRMDITRMVRNSETGKSDKVPHMNYKEWYGEYIESEVKKEYNGIELMFGKTKKFNAF